jgi:hypothetical protein
MRKIQIDRGIYDYLSSKATEAGELPSTILRRELRVPQPMETIEVDEQTYNFIVSKTVSIGESASSILRRELHMTEEPHNAEREIVIFHIPANTGAQPWNTPEAAVVAVVGDILRIINDDAVPHRLHTPGSPFPHPATDIMPGQAVDFVLQTVFDPNQSGPLYDHGAGRTAEFWIRVQPLR